MSRMVSIKDMIASLNGLTGTKDVSKWEDEFITSVVEQVERNRGDTSRISGKQLDVIERIYKKHFA